MSWFDTAGIASFAKSALTTAQKTIDKALDIQEEKNKRQETQPSGDSFFEAFGLSEKPSAAHSPKKLPEGENVIQSQALQHQSGIIVEGSGFWTDTWGSFFEIKGQTDSQSKLKNKDIVKDDIISECSQRERKDDAVLSQPHRASPFPGDGHLPPISAQNQDTGDNLSKSFKPAHLSEGNLIETVNTTEAVSTIEHFQNIEIENNTKASSTEIRDMFIVTEQPCSESITSDFSTDIHPLENLLFNNPKQSSEISPSQVNESICDKTFSDKTTVQDSSTFISSDPKVPLEKSTLAVPVKNMMDQSEFFELDMPASSEKKIEKVDSECDVIHLNKSQSTQDIMTTSANSFTHLTSAEIIVPISECPSYENSTSTLIIPDLPTAVAENIANWECCVINSVAPDIFMTDENENSKFIGHENEVVANQNHQGANPDSTFHAIGADSFGNPLWPKSSKTSQSIDESQNSSNEEQNSHHSDGSSNSSKDDEDTDTAEVKEYDSKSTSSNGSHTTSSSSFVKCSVDENDNFHREQSPVSTTASEKSDITKHESEHTTSGDENETATSSDIEILSPPNGENGDRNPHLKHVWLTRPPRFRRSESPTSDSSKDSMMPVVSELEEVMCEDENSATATVYHDKELGSHKHYSEDDNVGRLLQKQDELQTILDAREKSLFELSKENIELQENEQRLKNLMQKMRAEQDKESRYITSLTRELSQKLSLMEGQLKEAIKERNNLQSQLENTKQEIDESISTTEFEKVINEKDQEIQELIEEGQKLSKKELQHTTIIKKLRAKEKEMEKTVKTQNEKLDENTKEVERLRKSIDAKEEQEKKHIDAIRNLSNTVKKLEKEVFAMKSNLEDCTEKELSLKKSLDSTYKDLTELQKSYADKEKEVEELKSGLELQAQENLQQMLDNANKEAAREKKTLLIQIQELRCTMSRSEEDANLREKMFKTEIASLQKRLQEAEERNEDLTKNMSSASRPLVRQIENLQATYTAQTISWEKIEKNLTDRLSEAQNQVALHSEKERSATEKYLELQSKVTVLESQNSTLRKEKLQLTAEMESLKTRIVMLEEDKSWETYSLENMKQSFAAETMKLKQEKANLESTMSTCLEQLDYEKRRVQKLEEEIKIKDIRASIISGSSPCPSPTGSHRSSVSSMHNWSQDEGHEFGTSTPVNSYRMSVYESLRLGSGSSLLENLQSQLKQKEGEILQLQSEISKLEQLKETMTRELMLLSEQNEELDKKVNHLESVEKEYKDLDQKYNTLLQMYGEKVEETEELQLDLADVKSMYKAQIEELLRNKCD